MAPSQFGNPIWESDDKVVHYERRFGRQEGLDEALRLILGPSIMTNNIEFQRGVDAVVDLLKRRRAEL